MVVVVQTALIWSDSSEWCGIYFQSNIQGGLVDVFVGREVRVDSKV